MRMKKTAGCLMLLYVLLPSLSASAAELIPLGIPVGVCMTAQGVVVSSITTVESAAGTVSPAEKAGLQAGDILQTADGEILESSEQLAEWVKNGAGTPIRLNGLRDNVKISVEVQPVRSTADGAYHLGILIRDSMAGIGTVTYYDPADGSFGALGHPISDIDSGALLPLSSGTIVPAEVVRVVPGKSGEPGELVGSYDFTKQLGELKQNTACGIFGTFSEDMECDESKAIPTADADEVHTGKAEILSCVSGSTPKRYEVTIERVSPNAADRSLTFRVTDKSLLDQTGGIVPGMSGSPIIQDDKLIGAVTHVLVNNPTKGYGILIDNMLGAE